MLKHERSECAKFNFAEQPVSVSSFFMYGCLTQKPWALMSSRAPSSVVAVAYVSAPPVRGCSGGSRHTL